LVYFTCIWGNGMLIARHVYRIGAQSRLASRHPVARKLSRAGPGQKAHPGQSFGVADRAGRGFSHTLEGRRRRRCGRHPRKAGERIRIGDNITIVVNRVVGSRVSVGIEAPANVRIVRGELALFVDDGAGREPSAQKTASPVPMDAHHVTH